MACSVNNCFLVNAPAGSGKTTKIKGMVKDKLAQNPNDNILCITYTNRAADELSKDFKTKNIFVGTIHSFLNSFMSRYFSHSDILKLYFEIYGDKIRERILNSKNDENVVQSNAKYIEKYAKLDYETIKDNIKTIYYCESLFNRLYYGGLSHNDLISFSKLIFDRYPVLKTRISAKYQYVFIDEYQDTMADVLKIFYESIVGTNSKLYLFGDRMQQIYNNYNGSFEDEFKLFDNTEALNTNYRSTKEIVGVLNKLYNDDSFKQNSKPDTDNDKPNPKPVIIITNNPEERLNKITSQDPNTLVLYLLNKSRFSSIGALNLYTAYTKMEKYSYEKNVSAILTSSYEDNPDSILRFLYCIMEMYSCYKKRQYGVIIQIIKANGKSNSSPMFSRESTLITNHIDKQRIYDSLKQLFDDLDTDMPISDFLNRAKDTCLFNDEYIDDLISDNDIGFVLPVSIAEPKRVFEYLSDPRVSTQHGVKGESHESVVFVADDSKSTPIVHMYRFFDVLAQIPVSLKTFNSFYYSYESMLKAIESTENIKFSEMDKPTLATHKEALLNGADNLMKEFSDNPYFSYLCKGNYSNFLQKQTVKNTQECFKLNKVYGVLSAYKLFYVGCSRAREKLTVLIDKKKMQGNIESQIFKFKELGFEVIY